MTDRGPAPVLRPVADPRFCLYIDSAGIVGIEKVVLEPLEGKRTMRVAYFFSGMSRKASIGEELRRLCAKAGLGLVVDTIDIMNGGKAPDLLSKEAQTAWEAMVTGGEYD